MSWEGACASASHAAQPAVQWHCWVAVRVRCSFLGRCATRLDCQVSWGSSVCCQSSKWMHLQAGAGLVADSQPIKEYEETVNKAAALGRAIDLAEQAFL